MSDDIVISQESGHTFFEVPKGAQTRYHTHGYFRYIGKFPPQIPRYIISNYSQRGDLVYDPMCGGGTTLIEALLNGRKGMGSDINPIALLLSRIVSNPIDPSALEPAIGELLHSIAVHSNKPNQLLYSYMDKGESKLRPEIGKIDLLGTEKYYSEAALSAINIINSCFQALDDEAIREFALVALLAVLRRISNANNKKINVVVDPKAKVYPPYQTYFKQIDSMMRINRQFHSFAEKSTRVFKANATDTGLDKGVCDLIVVHPPYPTNTAFSEQLLLQLGLIGINHKDVWQDELAVRGSYLHKKNGVRYYLVGWFRIMKELHRVLRDGGHCGIVIGDGQIDFTRIPMGAITMEFAKDLGFDVVEYMTHRIHNATGWTLSRRMKHDYIVVLRK